MIPSFRRVSALTASASLLIGLAGCAATTGGTSSLDTEAAVPSTDASNGASTGAPPSRGPTDSGASPVDSTSGQGDGGALETLAAGESGTADAAEVDGPPPSEGGGGGAVDAAREADVRSDSGSYRPCFAGVPCAIMPLGDSITYGYGSTTGGGYRVDLFRRAVADNHAILFVGTLTSGPVTVSGKPFPQQNEGHSGYTIDDSVSTKGISPLVDQAIAAHKPDIVLLMIGTNDMHYSLDVPNAPTRLGKLVDRIAVDAPNALVLVAKIIPANGAQNALTLAYNAAISGVLQPRIAQGKHVAMVDVFSALSVWSQANYKDSEHPNDVGYAAMAQAWYAALQGVLP